MSTATAHLSLVPTPTVHEVAELHAHEAALDDRLDDAHTVGRVAAGDHAALEELYGRYGRIVHSLAQRITRDSGLAEECTQDVFLALWRSARDFDATRGRLTTWLMTITRNRAIEMVRHRGRRPALHDGDALALELEADERAANPVDAVADADVAERVAAAMAELPADQLEVVKLAYFDGLSQTEIAEVIGIPLGTVKGRMRLALDRLRTIVDTYDLSPEAA